MSLINCEECKKEISDKAVSCPSCGHPNIITKEKNERMSLINCKECKKEISEKAESCPSCGHPNIITKEKNIGCVSLFFSSLIIAIIFQVCSVDDESSVKVGEEKKSSVKVGEEKKSSVKVGEEKKSSVKVGEEKKSSVKVGEEKKSSVKVGEEKKSSVKVGEKKKSSYIIRDIDKLDYQYQGRTVKRRSVRAVIDEGLTKKEIKAEIKDMITEIRNKSSGIGAISIFLYKKGDRIDSSYTAASVDWAPQGLWSNADKQVSQKEYKTVINFASNYFKKKEKLLKKGTIISLKKGIIISSKPNSWGTDDILMKTKRIEKKIKILDRVRYSMTNRDVIRYKILMRKIQGWVHKRDIN